MSPSEPGSQQLSFVNEESSAFQLTGRTGSLMYMAPEVFNEQPYSEKVCCLPSVHKALEMLHWRDDRDLENTLLGFASTPVSQAATPNRDSVWLAL